MYSRAVHGLQVYRSMSACPDVAIVGAGFAGLAAARFLATRGVSVELFEATDRVGGRARTLNGIVELGPEFIHGCPDATLALVREAGLATEPVGDSHHRWRDGALVEEPDLWTRFGRLLEPAAELARQGAAHDVTARAYLERSAMADDDATMFAMLVEGFYAAPLADISIASVAEDAGGAGGDDAARQSRLAGGYGVLIDWLARELVRANVPIHFGRVVQAIDYQSDRVRIDYGNHGHHAGDTALARRAIVTLPLGVLLANDVRFHPDLGAHADALSRFAMGQVVKVVLCLRDPVWRDHGPPGLEFVHRRDGTFPTFWCRSTDREHLLTAWAGGPHAHALAGCTQAQLVDRVVGEFAATLAIPRATLASAILHEHFHDYAHDPFARGAYSYTRVHGAGAADILARPLAGKVFLAGEVTDAEYEGSVAGAIASGTRAARQILDAERSLAAAG